MLKLVAVKALAGFNYVRPDAVVAISATDPTKCTIYVSGGVAIPANEPAKDVMAKLGAVDSPAPEAQEMTNADAAS
jgi:hypothetical protein